MFFNDETEIKPLATSVNCAIFVVKNPLETLKNLPLKDKESLKITPDEKSISGSITINQIRDLAPTFNHKQTTDKYIIIAPAENLNDPAANALLKNLEEPQPLIHFLLLTKSPAALLPTILSRAQVFHQKPPADKLSTPVAASKPALDLARQLVVARPTDLPALAETIAKKKNPRPFALEVVSAALEILEKSYFKTNNPRFLTPIPNFLNLYDAIQKNGHLKLHFVADLC